MVNNPTAGNPRGKRDPYVIKQSDNTGKQGKENLLIKSFWKEHAVKDIMELTDQELEKVVEEFMETYISVQLSRNKRWDFPTHRLTLEN